MNGQKKEKERQEGKVAVLLMLKLKVLKLMHKGRLPKLLEQPKVKKIGLNKCEAII